ncbi:hypothetical protein R5W24_000470 [Gemmata sp. JC717]|uniref:hypothetical protein n=1 Tax=Gemmata algarum TaxID=2975278 RepID=UPI0021BB2643|nr:hypothetical protein [Gemmata algarum]MDY3551394.1 hypothetical protein [Gemmata algarum]
MTQQEFVDRIKALLPGGWFREQTPTLDGVLNGIAWALSAAHTLTEYARQQCRIRTATDGFLDLIALDYFGGALPRRLLEPDATYRARILAALFPEKGTRRGLVRTLEVLTGRTPWVFEPRRPADTGGYRAGGAGYGAGGGYGSVESDFQAFVVAYRPIGQGIPLLGGYRSSVGGYGVGSQLSYASLSQVQGAVTDADIYAAVDGVKPAGTTVWTRIES